MKRPRHKVTGSDASVRNDARSLAVEAVQFTERRRVGARGREVARQIRDTSFMILASFPPHYNANPVVPLRPRKAVGRLARLLLLAHREGVIGTFDLVLMLRTASAVNESLAAVPRGQAA